MAKIEVMLSSNQLTKEMTKLAKGRGGLLVIPMDYWDMLTDAYQSPLISRVLEASMPIRPVTEIETKKVKFRTNIEEK